jgi:hypothetical protein
MSTSYGHDQDAEPPTPDGEEPEYAEADDATQEDPEADQDAEPPSPGKTSEPPD